MEIAVNIALALAVGVFVLYPVVTRRNEELSVDVDGERDEVEVEKESVYAAIKDLDFDYRMGKISDEDYEDLRARFKGEAVALIKEAEQATDEEMDPLEAEIQAERAGAAKAEPRRKKSATAGTCANCGQAYTAADKFCAGCGRPLGVTGLQCPKCSAKVRKGDKFCESCGEKL